MAGAVVLSQTGKRYAHPAFTPASTLEATRLPMCTQATVADLAGSAISSWHGKRNEQPTHRWRP